MLGLMKIILFSIACLFGVVFIQSASALCLDPNTQVSGYEIPLLQEVQASEKIIIGTVENIRPLQEDQDDPLGVTAYVLSVKVLRKLKGTLPDSIALRIENNSSKYPIGIGEKHLLFLSRQENVFTVDSCGNSSSLPQGLNVLKQVEAELRRPNK